MTFKSYTSTNDGNIPNTIIIKVNRSQIACNECLVSAEYPQIPIDLTHIVGDLAEELCG